VGNIIINFILMSSFKGSYQYTIDAKGRINIPAKLRKAMDPSSNETFVVTRGMDGCLFTFPLDEWNRIEQKLRELSPTQEKHRRFIRIMLLDAFEVRCDRQGRIAIPSHLIKHAKIEKEVFILGALDRIEIWSPIVFNEYLQSSDESYENIAEKIVL